MAEFPLNVFLCFRDKNFHPVANSLFFSSHACFYQHCSSLFIVYTDHFLMLLNKPLTRFREYHIYFEFSDHYIVEPYPYVTAGKHAACELKSFS